MASRVGERGQITVEKAIREKLAVYGGDQAIQWVEDGRLVVEFVSAPHRRSLAGSLAESVTKRTPDEDWVALRDAARATPDAERLSLAATDEHAAGEDGSQKGR
jgi:bifunctional DNA-binding transcriptional regulator/antitoxin component of YhaV-PrlF toxin-antitoxin module